MNKLCDAHKTIYNPIKKGAFTREFCNRPAKYVLLTTCRSGVIAKFRCGYHSQCKNILKCIRIPI